MSKLKLWKPFSLLMVLLLIASLAAAVPAPVRANVSGITVNPYDTAIIGLNTGYRITMTTGATLYAGDNITIEFPPETVGLAGIDPFYTTINDQDQGASGHVSLDGQKVTLSIVTAPIIPGQQFTVTFSKYCGITNPSTPGPYTVTAWTNKEPKHVTSSSYEITAVKVYTGGTTFLSEHATIAAAITAASAGDKITVPAGIFTENLIVNKSLTLQGASSATVIVTAADPAVSVFNVTASSVNISGFTVTGANVSTTAGIYLGNDVANCNIHDNVLTGNGDGIWLGAGSNHNILMNNTVNSNTWQGFEVYISDYNTFTNNIANSNAKYGFKIDSGDHNTFTGNTANSNGDKGIYVVFGDGGGATNSTFTNNTANSNTRHGFHLIGGGHNNITLAGNTFNGNLVTGIKLQNVITNLTLDGNSISGNPTGIYISNENSPNIPDVTTWTVTHNNIAGNTTYGINNAGTGALNAKQNYWNNASGPSHDSLLSYGDKVSTGVIFSPWLVAAYTGTPPAGEITIATTTPLPDGNTGVAYSKTFSATGGSGPSTWAYYSGTMPPGLSFTGNNFSGTPTQVKADPGFDFAVQVSDGTQGTYKDFVMNVYSGVPVITTTSPLPNGTINVPYGPVQLQAVGGFGTGSYAWSLNVGSGPLPTGLNPISSDGKITGTPTAAGTFPFNVRVVSGSPGYKDLSITISAPTTGGTRLIGVDTGTASTGGNGGCSNVLMQRFLAGANGSITQFRVKASASGHVKVAIYSDNNTQPGILLNAVNTSTPVSAGAWTSIPIASTSVTFNNYYWLAVISDACNMYYHSSDPAATVRYKSATYSSWTYPDQPGSGWSTQTGYTYFMAGWAAVTVSVPTVSNSPASDIKQTSATLNGQVTGTGGENPTVIIYWGPTNGGTIYTNWANNVNLGTKDAVPFSTNITGLNANTLYYYNCFVANSGGNAWATPSASFTTSVLSAPTVTNASGATLVTATSARLNGAITGTGGQDPTVTIYWGDNDGITNSYVWDNNVNLGTKAAAFSTDITDLTLGTKYYYRCFASNTVGSSWAASENFTTLSGGVANKLIGVDTGTASTGGGGGCSNVMMQRFLASTTGPVTEFRVKASASGNVKVAIYDDSAGSPGALRNAVNASTLVSAGAWTSIPITSTAVISGTYYWLAVVSDSCNLYYHSSDPTATVRWKTSTYSSWTFPDPAGSGWSTQTGYTYFVAGWSTTISAPPAPPTIVAPKRAVTLEWVASGGATKYKLQVNPTSDFTATDVFNAEVNTTSQAVTLNVGTPYYWRVKAGNSGGWSGWSATGSVTP